MGNTENFMLEPEKLSHFFSHTMCVGNRPRLVFIFGHIYKMEGKSSAQRERFFTRFCQLCSRLFPFFTKLCTFAIECDWIASPKRTKFGFLKKLYFLEKFEFFSKSVKVAILLVNAYQMVLFLWNVFLALIIWFLAKIRIFLKLEKLGNTMKNECFFEKKNSFHLFKSLLYKNGKAVNMPVVAGRLVFNLVQDFFILTSSDILVI